MCNCYYTHNTNYKLLLWTINSFHSWKIDLLAIPANLYKSCAMRVRQEKSRIQP